ncbi:hypothetical protein EDB19DRAFT_1642717, partial [Suillus lakei]
QETTPFWKPSMPTVSHWQNPPFSFYLKHYVNQANRIVTAPGGVLTLGGTNSSLFKGSIECLNLTGPPSH